MGFWELEIHRVLKQFMVPPQKRLPFVAGDFGIGIKRFPVVFAVRNFHVADAALIDAIHKFCPVSQWAMA